MLYYPVQHHVTEVEKEIHSEALNDAYWIYECMETITLHKDGEEIACEALMELFMALKPWTWWICITMRLAQRWLLAACR